MHGSMHFNLSSVDLYLYVQIVSKFGPSRCSFSDRMTLVDQCSSQISLIGWPIAAPLFLGPGHSVDSVLAMCAPPFDVHMHFMPKSISFVHTSIIEDNAFMWFTLAFQIQYLDFYICFIAYCVIFREFLWSQVIIFDIMSLKLVHNIRNSLYSKHSEFL